MKQEPAKHAKKEPKKPARIMIFLLLLGPIFYFRSRGAQTSQQETSLSETTSQQVVETGLETTTTSQQVSETTSQTTQVQTTGQTQESSQSSQTPQTESKKPEKQAITYVQGFLIVNKKHGLPAAYVPGENPVAKEALLRLLAEMQNRGFAVSNNYSGYRSYSYQAQLYNDYVRRDGQAAADRYSARPGYSEHQTGLAFDILNSKQALLGTAANDGPATQWLAQNAHRYGFIIRYLPGKEAITGYMHEPWHIRYMGDIARDIYESGLTLEEYFGVPGGTNYE